MNRVEAKCFEKKIAANPATPFFSLAPPAIRFAHICSLYTRNDSHARTHATTCAYAQMQAGSHAYTFAFWNAYMRVSTHKRGLARTHTQARTHTHAGSHAGA